MGGIQKTYPRIRIATFGWIETFLAMDPHEFSLIILNFRNRYFKGYLFDNSLRPPILGEVPLGGGVKLLLSTNPH
jgi:hypothetical protein